MLYNVTTSLNLSFTHDILTISYNVYIYIENNLQLILQLKTKQ